MVAAADLCSRFPNIIEKYSERLYHGSVKFVQFLELFSNAFSKAVWVSRIPSSKCMSSFALFVSICSKCQFLRLSETVNPVRHLVILV